MNSSKLQLWVEHSLEPFLKWTNEFIMDSNRVCICGDIKHYYAAYIKAQDNTEKGGYADVFPVITNIDQKSINSSILIQDDIPSEN